MLIVLRIISLIIGFEFTPHHQVPNEFYSENKQSRVFVQEQLPNYLYTVKEARTNTIRYQFTLDCKAEKIYLSNDGERAVILTFTSKPQDAQIYLYVHMTGIRSQHILSTLLPKCDLNTIEVLVMDTFPINKPWYSRALCFFDDSQKQFLLFSEKGICLVFNFLTGKATIASSKARKSWVPYAIQKVEDIIAEKSDLYSSDSFFALGFLKDRDLKQVAIATLRKKLDQSNIESHYGTLETLIRLDEASAIRHLRKNKEDYIKYKNGVMFFTLSYAKGRETDTFLRELEHEPCLTNILLNLKLVRQFNHFRTLTEKEEAGRLIQLQPH